MDIKHTRQMLSMTQEQLAKKLGVTTATVNRWENDRHKPSPIAQSLLNELVKKSNSLAISVANHQGVWPAPKGGDAGKP